MQHIRAEKELDHFQVYGGEPDVNERNGALTAYLPGVVLQDSFISRDNPEAVTVSVGGNDIGFSDILAACVKPAVAAEGNRCYQTYEDRLELVNRINRKAPQLRQLYKSLRDGGAGVRKVYVIGYPQIAKVGGDCGTNVALDSEEVKFSADLIAYFDSVIERAAAEAGVVYVDTQAAFTGKRLCEAAGGEAAVNGFTLSRRPWGGIGLTESYHPTRQGHQMLADTIAFRTAGLTKPMPDPVPEAPYTPVDPGMPLLRNAPAGSRTLYRTEVLDGSDPGQIVQKGSTLDIIVNAREHQTKPGGAYGVTLHSTPVDVGTYTADAAGDLKLTLTIPGSVDPGFHTFHIRGVNVFGENIDLQRMVYVAGSADDYDGDGLANAVDSCELMTQSGLDIDVDGADDACDGVIGPAPVVPVEPEGIIWRDDAVLSIEIQATSGQ